MDRRDVICEFEKAKLGRELLTLICECEIIYSGRAEAHLPKGERLIILKQDGCLLIHQPEHGNPINYLKAGGDVTLEKCDNHLFLRGKFGKEFLDVEIYKVHNLMRKKMQDGQKQSLNGSEADMSDMLREQPHLIHSTFRPVSREEQTAVGFIDLFGHDGTGKLVVVECKRYTAGLSAISQLHRYVEKIKIVKGTTKVTGVMAAPQITPNAHEMLKNYGYSFACVQPPMRHARDNNNQLSLDGF